MFCTCQLDDKSHIIYSDQWSILSSLNFKDGQAEVSTSQGWTFRTSVGHTRDFLQWRASERTSDIDVPRKNESVNFLMVGKSDFFSGCSVTFEGLFFDPRILRYQTNVWIAHIQTSRAS